MFGVLSVDKPSGITSRKVVNQVQRIIRPVKVGHTGTLDPLASGVLLLVVGRATRLCEFAHDLRKEYDGTFILGAESESLDTDSDVRYCKSAPVPSIDQIREASGDWIGTITQTPPKFSAVHIDGKRAYALAREGKDFEVPTREVDIHFINVREYDYPNFRMQIGCGTGTYIRSLANDIAKCLGTTAVMSGLQRTAIGDFQLSECSDLEELSCVEAIESRLESPTRLLANLPTTTLSVEDAERIRNGVRISTINLEKSASNSPQPTGPVSALDSDGKLVAIIEQTPQNDYRSLRVFQIENATSQPSRNRIPLNPES